MTTNRIDPRLIQFCKWAGLEVEKLAGLTPTWNGMNDAYSVSGNGPVNGCMVQAYGRFGNNLLQLAHAIAFARKLNLKWVATYGFGTLFKSGLHLLSDGLELHIGTMPTNHGAALTGRFFHWWGLGAALRGFQGEKIAMIARNDLPAILDIQNTPNSITRPTLHLHVRGGDVFGPEGRVHSGYVQPPLSYYTMAAKQWIQTNASGHLVVVSQDTQNPCVNGLRQWAKANRSELRLQIGSEKEDVGSLFRATEIVAGFGMFIPMIVITSPFVRKVTYFRNAHQLAAARSIGKLVNLVVDLGNDYIPQGTWKNSSVQRQIMLNYPVEFLRMSTP